MKKLLFIIFNFGIFLNLFSCNYKKIKDPSQFNKKSGTLTVMNKSGTLGWEFIKENVLSSCMNCHEGGISPELSTLSSVRQNLDKMQFQIESNLMPKPDAGFAPLTDCQKLIFRTWVEQKAPETSSFLISDFETCKNTNTELEESEVASKGLPADQEPLWE